MRPRATLRPIIDSFGRVIFTQWDHLQRDQEADADANAGTPGENCYYGGPGRPAAVRHVQLHR